MQSILNSGLLPKVIDSHLINSLARSYSALHYSQKLRNLLNSVFPNTDFKDSSKYQLHKTVNDTLINIYSGEEVIKYLLIKEFFNKKVTAAFELRVNNSRIDFLTINGDTKSFEIKSGLDNLDKLSKQMNDYVKVFEYNYIVIDEKHLRQALNIVPQSYGIWVYKRNRKEVIREAIFNFELDPLLQLNLFTKKELSTFFKGYNSNREKIKECFSNSEINSVFKTMLKNRYANKWSFIKEHKEQILPIDFHFFYHNNISPKLIYGIS